MDEKIEIRIDTACRTWTLDYFRHIASMAPLFQSLLDMANAAQNIIDCVKADMVSP